MDKERGSSYGAHVLALPYPSQGHVNPMLQFCKRLVSKGLKTTFAITTFISNTMNPQSNYVQFDTISDGYDEGGFMQAGDVQAYLTRLEATGSKTLADLIKRHQNSDHPIDCIVYDAFLPWALEVAKEFGLAGAAFFTQPCAVNYIYYYAHNGLLKLPVERSSLPVSIPGMPMLELEDMPSFIYVHGIVGLCLVPKSVLDPILAHFLCACYALLWIADLIWLLNLICYGSFGSPVIGGEGKQFGCVWEVKGAKSGWVSLGRAKLIGWSAMELC